MTSRLHKLHLIHDVQDQNLLYSIIVCTEKKKPHHHSSHQIHFSFRSELKKAKVMLRKKKKKIIYSK